MLDWGVDPDEVIAVLASGETIEEYEDGSRLVLGRSGARPLHVAMNEPQEDTAVVITVYEPSLDRWDASFRTRRNT